MKSLLCKPKKLRCKLLFKSFSAIWKQLKKKRKVSLWLIRLKCNNWSLTMISSFQMIDVSVESWIRSLQGNWPTCKRKWTHVSKRRKWSSNLKVIQICRKSKKGLICSFKRQNALSANEKLKLTIFRTIWRRSKRKKLSSRLICKNLKFSSRKCTKSRAWQSNPFKKASKTKLTKK